MLRRKVSVGRARHGRGVFARISFQAEEVIGEVRGRVIDDSHYGSSYSMDLGGSLTLEPRAPFRYLNHSCSPNCELFMYEAADEPSLAARMFLQAIAAIEPGEELTIDYGWPADTAIPCDCSAINCRGWIVDPAELHLVPEPAAAVA
jgi:SET domain-containing protein